MKVRIGPYKSWLGPYQLAEKLMFWVPKEKDEYGFPRKPKLVHQVGEWLAYGKVSPEPKVGETSSLFGEDRKPTRLYKLLSWIHDKRKRNINVHIDDYDVWDMHVTLGYIIRPMLQKLQNKKHGAPFVDDEDVPEYLRSTAVPPKENDWDTDDNHFKRWDWVLSEMLFAFETLEGGANQNWEDQFTTGEHDFQFVKNEEGSFTMIKGENHTAKTDYEAKKAYADRISKGFMLFGKYYEALWD